MALLEKWKPSRELQRFRSEFDDLIGFSLWPCARVTQGAAFKRARGLGGLGFLAPC